MKQIKQIVASLLFFGAMASPLSVYAEKGIEINHLGINNTLVRVTGPSRYLLLPIQEDA